MKSEWDWIPGRLTVKIYDPDTQKLREIKRIAIRRISALSFKSEVKGDGFGWNPAMLDIAYEGGQTHLESWGPYALSAEQLEKLFDFLAVQMLERD